MELRGKPYDSLPNSKAISVAANPAKTAKQDDDQENE
jgi:hypothetical protein